MWYKPTLLQQYKQLWRDRRGVQAIEFAFVAPLLLIMLLGVVEVGRYIYAQQKVSKTSYAISDLVSQLTTVSEAEITAIFNIAERTMYPFTFEAADNASALISATNNDGGAEITWQRSINNTRASRLGTEGTQPDFAAITSSGFALEDGESAYVVEVFYDYRPIFAPSAIMDLFESNRVNIYHYTILRPRTGELIPELTL